VVRFIGRDISIIDNDLLEESYQLVSSWKKQALERDIKLGLRNRDLTLLSNTLRTVQKDKVSNNNNDRVLNNL
jgi:hypothetical protein